MSRMLTEQDPDARYRRMRRVLSIVLFLLLTSMIAWQSYVLRQNLAQQEKAQARTEFRELLFVKDQAAVVVVDADTNLIVDWNYGAERALGWRTHEVIGYDMDFLLPEELRKKHKGLLRQTETRDLLQKNAIHMDCWVYTKSGTPVYMNMRVRGLKLDRYYFVAILNRPTNIVRVPLKIDKPPVKPENDKGPKQNTEKPLPKAK